MSSTLPIAGADKAAFHPDSRSLVTVPALVRWRWVAWIGLALLLYYPVFFARPVFDDLAHVEFAAQQGWHLLQMGPIFFRPLERILIGLNWALYRDNFWIVKAVGLVVFACNVALVYDLAKRIVTPGSPWAPFVIATLFLVHPMHVSAVGKIDTFSEHLTSLFALLTVRCAICAAADAVRDTTARRTGIRWAMWSVPAIFLGMLSKEAFAGIAAATPFFFAVALGVSKESRKTLGWLVAGECVAALAYFACRIAFGFPLTGALIDVARYHLHFGANVPMNLAAELASIAFPGSTLALFVRFDAVEIAISLTVLAMLLVLFQRRVRDMITARVEIPPERRRAILIVLIAAGAAFIPTCFIPELISENQTALALPFVVLLALAAPLSLPLPLDPLPLGKGAPSHRVALACACVAAFLCMAHATSQKVLAMRATSDRAYRIGDLILARFREHPSAAVTVCFEPGLGKDRVKYSIFSLPDDRAALFQLTRLRIEQPGVDLRVGNDFSQCTLHVAGMSVTR
jgi:hypothetical protein